MRLGKVCRIDGAGKIGVLVDPGAEGGRRAPPLGSFVRIRHDVDLVGIVTDVAGMDAELARYDDAFAITPMLRRVYPEGLHEAVLMVSVDIIGDVAPTQVFPAGTPQLGTEVHDMTDDDVRAFHGDPLKMQYLEGLLLDAGASPRILLTALTQLEALYPGHGEVFQVLQRQLLRRRLA